MHSTLIQRALLIVLLGVDLVQLLGSNGGGVRVDDVQRSGWALFTFGLRLGDLVVVDGRGAAGPDGAENAVLFAVQQSKVGGSSVRREKEDRFLDEDG